MLQNRIVCSIIDPDLSVTTENNEETRGTKTEYVGHLKSSFHLMFCTLKTASADTTWAHKLHQS